MSRGKKKKETRKADVKENKRIEESTSTSNAHRPVAIIHRGYTVTW